LVLVGIGFRDIELGWLQAMNNKKPDALMILAVIFAVGVLVSAISHGGGENRAEAVAVQPGYIMPGQGISGSQR